MYALGPQRANVMNYAYGTNYSDTYFFGKQLTSVIIAVVAFSVFYFVPYKWFTGERSKYVLWAGFLSCVLLFLLGSLLHLSLAKETNGAYRWFYLGGLGSFQPSELLKYGILLFLAGFLGRRASQGKINDFHETLVPVGVISAISLLVIVVLQKDLGTGVFDSHSAINDNSIWCGLEDDWQDFRSGGILWVSIDIYLTAPN